MDFTYKKLMTLVVFVCCSAYAFSQASSKTLPNSYFIHGNVADEKMAFYLKSIDAADFEQYRLRDANLELVFKNGFSLELISAKDLTIKHKMQNVNPNLYKESSSVPKGYVYPIFEINDAGWILALFQAKETKIKKP